MNDVAEEPFTAGMPDTCLTLTAFDRCDRCGAQAYYKTVRANYKAADERGSDELLFCGHHMRKNHTALIADAWVFAL